MKKKSPKRKRVFKSDPENLIRSFLLISYEQSIPMTSLFYDYSIRGLLITNLMIFFPPRSCCSRCGWYNDAPVLPFW